jgi:anthranilate phosphoribosyltransferase
VLADLTPILAQRSLAPAEISASVAALLDPSFPTETKASFLRAWSERGETAAELAACAEALLPAACDPGVRGSWRGRALLDCCGTGGGGLPLLNISTGMMFILAAIGIPVVKHGNRGLTKKSGSADVLEALGVRIDLPPEQTVACLEEVGCAFLFAPAYHLSFQAVASVRRQLGIEGRRTVFNLLGPLLNPARPDARLVGVFEMKHVTLYDHALREMKCPRFTVVCGEDAGSGRMLGEASAHGKTMMSGTPFDNVIVHLGQRFGDPPGALDGLLVADAADSARRLEGLLRGDEHGFARDMLMINAALGAWTHGLVPTLEEGQTLSGEAIDSGRAHDCLRRWRAFSARSR